MKWKKLGKIFDPTEYRLPNNCLEFAQSPQVLELEHCIRIYFSTRQKDKTGKFLSHISFIDMDKDFKKIINVASNTVIELGNAGCFDEHGIFPINVLRHEEKIYAYTCGWSRRVSVSVETSIGFAVSDDNGLTFTKKGEGPILSSSLFEPLLVGDAFVKVFDDLFHMWYIYGTKWMPPSNGEPAARVYKIAHATSRDGIVWQREQSKQIVTDVLGEDECQALPSVVKVGDIYHMYFCFRQATDFRKNANRGYRLGYAWSQDLLNWTRDDENAGIDVSAEGWDSEMMAYPHIFECDDNVYLLYNGNEFGRQGFGIAVLEQ